MLETLAPKSRVDELEEEASVLRSVVRQHSRDIELLKHVQESRGMSLLRIFHR